MPVFVAGTVHTFLSTPSFGGEVKPSVPCRRFVACKRSLNLSGSRNLGKNYRTNFSPTVPPFATRISRVFADVQAPGVESGNALKAGESNGKLPSRTCPGCSVPDHTGHMTELWFLPARPLRLNTNE